jgi:hypothetical protein
MASYQLSARVGASAAVSSLPIGWNIPSNYKHSQGVAPIADGVGVHAELLTPSDSVTFSPAFRWAWINSEGDVAVRMADGSCFVWSDVPSGTRLPFTFTQLLSLTTASVVGVY